MLVGLCMVMVVVGASIGLFSGIVLRIHINTLAVMLLTVHLAIAGVLSGSWTPMGRYCCERLHYVCIRSSTFVDFVPSVFIGVPNGEDAVSVLPEHRLLLQGKGMAIVRAVVIGSLGGLPPAILMSISLQWLLINDLEDPLERMMSSFSLPPTA